MLCRIAFAWILLVVTTIHAFDGTVNPVGTGRRMTFTRRSMATRADDPFNENNNDENGKVPFFFSNNDETEASAKDPLASFSDLKKKMTDEIKLPEMELPQLDLKLFSDLKMPEMKMPDLKMPDNIEMPDLKALTKDINIPDNVKEMPKQMLDTIVKTVSELDFKQLPQIELPDKDTVDKTFNNVKAFVMDKVPEDYREVQLEDVQAKASAFWTETAAPAVDNLVTKVQRFIEEDEQFGKITSEAANIAKNVFQGLMALIGTLIKQLMSQVVGGDSDQGTDAVVPDKTTVDDIDKPLE